MFIENSQNDQNNRIEQLNNINKTSLEWYHSLNILDTIFFFLKKEKKKRSYINIEEPITIEKELNGFFSNLKRHLRYIRDVHV